MRRPIWLSLLVVLLLLAGVGPVGAEEFGRPAFRARWQRTDLPVERRVADHSWIWGPGARQVFQAAVAAG